MLTSLVGSSIFNLLLTAVCSEKPQFIQPDIPPDNVHRIYVLPPVPGVENVHESEDIAPFIHRKLNNEDIKNRLDSFRMTKQNSHNKTNNGEPTNQHYIKNAPTLYQTYTYDNINQISPRIQNDFNYFHGGVAPRVISQQPANGESKFPTFPNLHIPPKIPNGYTYMNLLPKFGSVNLVSNVNNKMDSGIFSLRLNNNGSQIRDDKRHFHTHPEMDAALTEVLLRQNEIAEKLVTYLENHYKHTLELRSKNEFDDLMKDMTTSVKTTKGVHTMTLKTYELEPQLIDRSQIKEALKNDPLVKRVLQIMKMKRDQFLNDN